MLEFYPGETKKRFTQRFIREVILNTSSANFYFLEELISRKEEEQKKKKGGSQSSEVISEILNREDIKKVVNDYYNKSPRERVREYFRETGDKVSFDVDFEEYDSAGKKIERPKSNNLKRIDVRMPSPPQRVSFSQPSKQVLRVHEGSILPNRFKDLRPVRENQLINLGKLNVLLNDPNVRSIECPGAGTSVFVNGSMGRKPTNIILSKEEVDNVIQTFSENAKIPVEEGIFKVAYGGLVLTATVSSSGSSFLIKKI